jgi:hypothetical protein
VLETSDVGRIRLSEFTVPVTFYLKLVLEYDQMEVSIAGAIGNNPQFTNVGSYNVTDLKLAAFKVNMALRALTGYRVFGSGFPTWPRDFPEIDVDVSGNFLFLHDRSQIPHAKK